MKSQESRELRALDRILRIAYYFGWVLTIAWLIGLPTLRFLPPDIVDRSFTIDVPASIDELNTTVIAQWEAGAVKYAFDDVRGDVEIPVSVAPLSLLIFTWLVWAIICGLTLVMLYHGRRLVRRARGGAPFDAENAIIVRRIGLLLLVQYIVKAFYVFGASNWLVVRLDSTSVPLSSAPYANWSVLLAALVLLALAEIFRRGTALEHEQSLVV
jgi:hypothetical protein